MRQKINRWKKKAITLFEEENQKSIKNQIKAALRSRGFSEYYFEVVKNQEASDRFE